jgi:hypothetical protein
MRATRPARPSMLDSKEEAMATGTLDLSKQRTPSGFRNLLEVRVGRLRQSKSRERQIEALREIRDIADAALRQYGEG